MAFPTTSLLDNFDRADSGTLGASWLSPIESGFGMLDIISNQAGSAASFDDAYWATSFGANQEVYVTVTAMTSGTSDAICYCRIQNPGGASLNAYRLNQLGNGSGFIEKVVAGTATALGGGWISGSVVVNDKVGLECNGTTITAYVFHSGAWSVLESLTDSAVTGAGFIGLQIRGETVTRYNDFSGGTIVVAAAPVEIRHDFSTLPKVKVSS